MGVAKDLVVIGGGGHARVIIEAARSQPSRWNVVGFVDPAPCADTIQRLKIRRLGEDDSKVATDPAYTDCSFVIGVGGVAESGARRTIVERCQIDPARWAVVVHALAWTRRHHHSPGGPVRPVEPTVGRWSTTARLAAIAGFRPT